MRAPVAGTHKNEAGSSRTTRGLIRLRFSSFSFFFLLPVGEFACCEL
jgi:hypothetical protein